MFLLILILAGHIESERCQRIKQGKKKRRQNRKTKISPRISWQKVNNIIVFPDSLYNKLTSSKFTECRWTSQTFSTCIWKQTAAGPVRSLVCILIVVIFLENSMFPGVLWNIFFFKHKLAWLCDLWNSKTFLYSGFPIVSTDFC